MDYLKAAGRRIGYWLLRLLVALAPLVPLRALLRIGAALGDLIRLVSRKRRTVAENNVRLALGGTTDPATQERLVRESFRQFGMFAVECIKFATMEDTAAQRLLGWEEDLPDLLREAAGNERRLIFVSAHFGNFELAARTLGLLGFPVLVVVRPTRDAPTTELMTRLRRRNGMEVVLRDQAARPMLRALREGRSVALLADQNAGDLFLPFFGREAGCVDGPARLALATGSNIFVGSCIREPGPRYITVAAGVIRPNLAAPRDEEVVRITLEMNALLEKLIRMRPEQWLWFHDRWRSARERWIRSADSNERADREVRTS